MAFVNLPPNLQDIFKSITDRVAKLETGPNQAMYTAVVANEGANQAIAEATQALIQAQAAYAIGSQSLIKSANTITNAQNQITGINGNGITVYSGSSSTSGARVILNSAGIAGFNSSSTGPSNGRTFAIDSSNGNVSTTGAIFTDSQIFGGSLNINGNAIITSAGYLTAYGATITGTIYAGAGSFAGSVTSTSGQIGGFDLGPTYLQNPAGTIRLNSNTATATFASITVNGNISTSGITNSGTLSMGGNAINNAGAISAASLSATGALSAGTTVTSTSAATVSTSAATNCYITTGGLFTRTSTTSSIRYKENITDIVNVPELNPKALLDLPVRAFSYKSSHLPDSDDRANTMLPGFIAEEVDAIYPIAADYDNGVETWNYFYIIPALLSLIQNQEKRIIQLEAK